MPRTLTRRSIRVRLALMAALCLAALTVVAALRPIPQDTAYHNFADQRSLLGLPHCLNVLSNIPFVLVGIGGMVWLLRPRVWQAPQLFATTWERWAFLVLFVFVALTGFGSAYYHAQPDNATLFLDRLPLTVVFMTFFAMIVTERVGPRWGLWLWPLLLVAGIVGVSYWKLTELQGEGDVRFYALVQFLPILLIPILLLAFPARYYRTVDLFAILGWYVLAKALEMTDGMIYSASGVVSGHTLKHLVAALGALWMIFVLARRASEGLSPLVHPANEMS
jgi:hypothetical protein